MAPELPQPKPGRSAAQQFVADHLGHLAAGPLEGSATISGGQSNADAALAAFDVSRYASTRNEVWPANRQGASRLSPYIRHGLLQLSQVWHAVEGGPQRDVAKFRDELMWQEFARHWYGRRGRTTKLRSRTKLDASVDPDAVWDRSMACIELGVDGLMNEGWVINQQRMWLASHWAVRQPLPWQIGEDVFFRHLLDGSRAANRLGWQWTAGVSSSKPYGFSRWQVNKRAPGLCEQCVHRDDCPIEDWPDDTAPRRRVIDPGLDDETEPEDWAGPRRRVVTGPPDFVWLTAESLGTSDPALVGRPDLPSIFVFDEPLLAHLQLSAKRLIFLVETLAELANDRDLTVMLGDPVDVLSGSHVATTYAPVPGFRAISRQIQPVEMHPWPWLCAPSARSIASFSAWRRTAKPSPSRDAVADERD